MFDLDSAERCAGRCFFHIYLLKGKFKQAEISVIKYRHTQIRHNIPITDRWSEQHSDSSWHLLVGEWYYWGSEHFVLKLDVLEAGKNEQV